MDYCISFPYKFALLAKFVTAMNKHSLKLLNAVLNTKSVMKITSPVTTGPSSLNITIYLISPLINIINHRKT